MQEVVNGQGLKSSTLAPSLLRFPASPASAYLESLPAPLGSCYPETAHIMSSAATSTPQTHMSPKDYTSPNNAEHREETWSADEDEDEDVELDGDPSPKRKRQRTSRPVSVSCEKCKERKVSCAK